MIKRMFLLVALLFVLIGCAQESDNPISTQTTEADELKVEVKSTSSVDYGKFTRIVDTEAQVVCYKYWLSSSVALDCMPLSETSLDY